MSISVCLFAGLRPGLTIQQLNRHLIARIELFNFDRHIDEAIGLDHRRKNTGALISGRPNLEHTCFPSENAAQEMPTIAALGEHFLKDRLHHRSSIAPTPAHLE